MDQNKVSQSLTNLLLARNFDLTSKNALGLDPTADSPAITFKFSFKALSGKDYGTVVILLNKNEANGNQILSVSFGDNIGRTMEDKADKNDWFAFLEQMKNFAVRNRYEFTTDNINKVKYKMQGQAAIKEGLFENWSGTKTRSWNGAETEARLMIKHKRAIGENDARFRYVESLFVETSDGERFKLPFIKLSGGRAMLEHVRQGGKPYDIRGNHIASIVTEINLLSRFKRANQGKIFEGATAQLVESASMYYETLQHNLKKLSSKTGYTKYFETWDPATITDEDVIIEDLRHMFVEQNIDSRVEQVLPLLAKLQKEQKVKEANIFESWTNLILEGIFILPDTKAKQARLAELLSQELPVGAQAVNAIEQLEDLFDDSELFDKLRNLADENADADARDIILARLEDLKDNPDIAQVIGQLADSSSDEEVDEGWKGKLAAAGLAGATALGGYAAGSHSPTGPTGYSDTQRIDQFNKPTTSHVQPVKTQADLDRYNKTRPSGSSKLSNFEEGKETNGNWLEGQYGHSGKMKPVTGGDADTIARLKFLSGISK